MNLQNTTPIHLATDHAGFQLKEQVKTWLLEHDYQVVDHGALEYDETDDYPDTITPAARSISEHPDHKAIIFGGSGQGEAIIANRFKNVRAVVWYGGDRDIIRLSREHNDANVLSVGARFVQGEDFFNSLELWLTTAFPGDERHVRRIEKIDQEHE